MFCGDINAFPTSNMSLWRIFKIISNRGNITTCIVLISNLNELQYFVFSDSAERKYPVRNGNHHRPSLHAELLWDILLSGIWVEGTWKWSSLASTVQLMYFQLFFFSNLKQRTSRRRWGTNNFAREFSQAYWHQLSWSVYKKAKQKHRLWSA